MLHTYKHTQIERERRESEREKGGRGRRSVQRQRMRESHLYFCADKHMGTMTFRLPGQQGRSNSVKWS